MTRVARAIEDPLRDVTAHELRLDGIHARHAIRAPIVVAELPRASFPVRARATVGADVRSRGAQLLASRSARCRPRLGWVEQLTVVRFRRFAVVKPECLGAWWIVWKR